MSRAALLAASLLCAAGCKGDQKPGRPGPESDPAPFDAHVAAADIDAAVAADSPLRGTGQLVVAVSADWDAPVVELRRFERGDDGAWREVGEPWPATIGRAGMGWGRGMLGERAPALGGRDKVEGDGRSPAGVFAIGGSLGYAPGPPLGATLPYQALTDTWRCVDDSESEYYNRVFDAAEVEETWKSAEDMRRRDELYQWIIVIDHNDGLGTLEAARAPTPRAGSCIFFHVWRQPGAPTVGCVAMDRSRIEDLMAWLSPDRHPAVVLLPRPVFDAKRQNWHLPAL